MASIINQAKATLPTTLGGFVDPKDRTYVKWDAPGVEQIQEGEEESIKAACEYINTTQKANYNKQRHAFGGE
jgi:hypothetical protein